MHRVIPSMALVLFVMTVSPAQAYQFFLGVGYSESSFEFDSAFLADRDFTEVSIAGTYYFGDVDVSTGPLALAPFIDRASGVSLAIDKGEFDSAFGDIDSNGYSVSGLYNFSNTGWLVGGHYGHEKTDGIRDSTVDVASVYAGKYIAPLTRVIASVRRTNRDSGFSSQDDDGVSLAIRHVRMLDGSRAYRASFSIGYEDAADGDDAVRVGLSGRYYFNRDVDLGVGYDVSSGEFADISSVALRSEWFVVEEFSLSAIYSVTKYESNRGVGFIVGNELVGDAEALGTPDSDTTRFALSAEFRF